MNFNETNYDSKASSKRQGDLHRQNDSEVRISLVGDVLLHSNLLTLGQTAGDYTYRHQLEPLAATIRRADCTSANLESIAAGEQYGLSGFPKFNSPEGLLDGLRETGFQVLSVANNHMLDKGEQALLTSISNATERGFQVTGAASSEDNLARGATVNINGTRVGFVSFTDGAKVPTKGTQTVHINHFPGENSIAKMARRVALVKKQVNAIRANTDVVVLQLHFGEEYHKYPSAFQKELAMSLCELNIDVLVGHHPHVLQPMEWIENSRGKRVLVAYSLGNYFSGQTGIHRQIGGIFSFSVKSCSHNDKIFKRVADPELLLTYTDNRDQYAVKPLSEIVSQKPWLNGPEGIALDTRNVYDEKVKHLASLAPDIKVH